MGIILCGLNGCGKSTVGRALADALGWRFIDNEDLYFPKADPEHPYAAQRSQVEVERLLLAELTLDDRFVFAAVRGNYGEAVLARYRGAVLLHVPREVRLMRVRQRSVDRFGERALPGGDLFASEMAFFDLISRRPEDYASRWLTGSAIPLLHADGTQPVQLTVSRIIRWMEDSRLI